MSIKYKKKKCQELEKRNVKIINSSLFNKLPEVTYIDRHPPNEGYKFGFSWLGVIHQKANKKKVK